MTTPAGFDYHAPRSVAEAVKLLGELGPDARLLAGGHSLLPMMKLRFAQPAHLVDLGRIAALRGIAASGDDILIGAMTTEAELLRSPLLAEKLPLLVEGATRSPTRRCATRARSAATSRTATRATTIRR
jgi:carbon-monoxide dehydrogenase medium subunit